jgi:hypothetical protein
MANWGNEQSRVLKGLDLINHHIEEVEEELTPLKVEAIQLLGKGRKPITAKILAAKATHLGMYHDFLVQLREEYIREREEAAR